MIKPTLLTSTLLVIVFFTTTIHAGSNHKPSTSKQPGKQQISSTEKQKGTSKKKKKKRSQQSVAVMAAKGELRPLRKEHSKQKRKYSKAEAAYTQAKIEVKNAKGTKARGDAANKLMVAEKEYFAARSTFTRATTSYVNAKDKLAKLRKDGWEKFLADQQARIDKSKGGSVSLPRANYDAAGKADKQKFRKKMLRAEIKHAFASQ